MNKAKIYLCVCLCGFAVLLTPAKGDVIEVRNMHDFSSTLSDLIVYGDPNEKKVILAPNDPNDDIDFSPHMGRLFTADFKIASYVISTGGPDPKGGYYELETGFFNVRTIVPKKVGMIRDPDEQQTVVLAVDQAIAPDPPPEGTILTCTDGYCRVGPEGPVVSGWLVGTGINYDNGEVTGAYTGNVEVFSIPFEVRTFATDDTQPAETTEECGPTQEELTAPPTPEGYVYMGYVVVVNFSVTDYTYPLDRADSPEDIVCVRSHTVVRDGVTVCDVIVTHHFAPKEEDCGPTEEELTPPLTPEGYVYVGYNVVVNSVLTDYTVPLDRPDSPDDLVFVRSHTIVKDGVTVCDVIVTHVFAPKVDEEEEEEEDEPEPPTPTR